MRTTGNSRELFILCLISAAGFAAFTIAGPLVPLFLVSMNASPSLLGLVISVSTVGSLLVAVPGGLLVNTWGTRGLMLRSGLLVVAASVFLAVFPTVAALFAGLIFFEIGKILFILGAQSHVGHLGPDRDLNMDFGWYGTAASVGQMIGPVIAGVAIDTAGHSLTWVLLAVFMGGTLFLLSSLKETRTRLNAAGEKVRETATPGKKKKGIKQFLSLYAFIAILTSFTVIFADGARNTFYPVLLKDFGYTATVIGLYLSLRAFASVSMRLFMARLITLLGGRIPALIASLFLLAAGIGTTPFCTGYILLSFNALLLGAGIGLALPLSMAMVSDGVEPEDRESRWVCG